MQCTGAAQPVVFEWTITRSGPVIPYVRWRRHIALELLGQFLPRKQHQPSFTPVYKGLDIFCLQNNFNAFCCENYKSSGGDEHGRL